MPPTLPPRAHLPEGLVVRLSDVAARRAVARLSTDSSTKKRLSGGVLEALDVLSAEGVVQQDNGEPLDVQTLALRDLHTLRALLLHAGVLEEPIAELPCENCGETFRIAPSSALETNPFVDGELDDPELDKRFAYQRHHVIPAIRVQTKRGARIARTVRIAHRTVKQAMALFEAEDAASFRITPAITSAMGIVALGNERRASVIADALSTAKPTAYQRIVDLLYEAHYGSRLVAIVRCKACGGRNDLDVPWVREIPYEMVGAPSRKEPFPDLDTFEQWVKEAAEQIFVSRGVRNIDLVVHDDVPYCDDGGEPLLGCYTPQGTDETLGIEQRPEIRVFYRTFRREHEEDPAFDVRSEIEETIDHEITHHLHQLAGDDPLDDEERDAITKETQKRVGKRELRRRAQKSLAEDVTGFVRTMWPLIALGLAATILSFCSAFGHEP